MLRRMGRQDTEYRVGPQSDDVPEVGGGSGVFLWGWGSRSSAVPAPSHMPRRDLRT